jgi:hypothetical protein
MENEAPWQDIQWRTQSPERTIKAWWARRCEQLGPAPADRLERKPITDHLVRPLTAASHRRGRDIKLQISTQVLIWNSHGEATKSIGFELQSEVVGIDDRLINRCWRNDRVLEISMLSTTYHSREFMREFGHWDYFFGTTEMGFSHH